MRINGYLVMLKLIENKKTKMSWEPAKREMEISLQLVNILVTRIGKHSNCVRMGGYYESIGLRFY